jgi:hypothetical protein
MAILNIYALIIGVPTFIKQTLLSLKEYIRLDTIIVGDCNTLSSIDRSRQKKSKKDIPKLINTDEIDLRGIYRLFHSRA